EDEVAHRERVHAHAVRAQAPTDEQEHDREAQRVDAEHADENGGDHRGFDSGRGGYANRRDAANPTRPARSAPLAAADGGTAGRYRSNRLPGRTGPGRTNRLVGRGMGRSEDALPSQFLSAV